MESFPSKNVLTSRVLRFQLGPPTTRAVRQPVRMTQSRMSCMHARYADTVHWLYHSLPAGPLVSTTDGSAISVVGDADQYVMYVYTYICELYSLSAKCTKDRAVRNTRLQAVLSLHTLRVFISASGVWNPNLREGGMRRATERERERGEAESI